MKCLNQINETQFAYFVNGKLVEIITIPKQKVGSP